MQFSHRLSEIMNKGKDQQHKIKIRCLTWKRKISSRFRLCFYVKQLLVGYTSSNSGLISSFYFIFIVLVYVFFLSFLILDGGIYFFS
jgi:hypothetical protein